MLNCLCRGGSLLAALLFLSSAATAASDPEGRCHWSTYGPYNLTAPAFTLSLKKPRVDPQQLAEGPVEARKRQVLARQLVHLEPDVSYLPRTLDFKDEKGRSLGEAVPLQSGAPITRWVGPDGSARRCSIGWKDGPLGPAVGYGHYRWICFEDRDGDGSYESAFRPLSKNLGLSYSQFDMAIEPPIRFAEASESAVEPQDAARNLGALSPGAAVRGIFVSKLTSQSITLEYLGPGTSAEKDNRRVELPLDQPGEATLAGITVRLTPSGKGKAMLTASGTFDPLDPVPACNGATWRMGDYIPMVNWSFPTW